MAWFHIQHKATGAESFAQIDLRYQKVEEQYAEDEFTATQLPRKPGAFDRMAAGALAKDASLEAATSKRERFEAMGKPELIDFVLGVIAKGDARLDKIEARLAALEAR